MDTVTHCLIGTFTYSLLPKPYKVKNLLLSSIILAILPDIDVAFGYTQELYLLLHRGITHSLLLIPFASLLITYLLLRFVIPKDTIWRYGTLYAYVLLLLVEHIYADVITNYGTSIFLPLSPERIRLPGLFIIDLCVIFLLIIGSILGFTKRYKAGYIIAGILCIYPLLSLGIGSYIEHSIHKRYLPLLSAESRVLVYPAPFAPFYWNVIIEDNTSYYQTRINALTHSITPLIQYSKLDNEFMESLRKQGSFFRTYLDFSENMVVVTRRERDNTAIAPLILLPVEGDFVGRTKAPFEIILHSKDNVVEWIELFTALFPWKYDTSRVQVEEPFSLPNMTS